MTAQASLLYTLVPRTLFLYLLLAALSLFTCDKGNLFSAAPSASLTDFFNEQATGEVLFTKICHLFPPFIRLTPVPKWVIIWKSIGPGIQSCMGDSSSPCRLVRMPWACLLQASGEGSGVLWVARCSAEGKASVGPGWRSQQLAAGSKIALF